MITFLIISATRVLYFFYDTISEYLFGGKSLSPNETKFNS